MENSSQEKEKDIKRFALNEDTWTDSIKNKENVYWSHSRVWYGIIRSELERTQKDSWISMNIANDYENAVREKR